MSGRYQRLADLLELTGMLRARATGITIDEIAERFEVGRRTAERMLSALRDRFPEIESDLRDGRKYWAIPRAGALTAIELPAEVAMLSRRVAELEADAVQRDSSANPLDKIADEVLGRSSVGVFVLDADFRVIWVNQAIQTYFGFAAADVVGADKRKLIHDRIRGIFDEPEEFERFVLATYADNTYIEHFECHVLPDSRRSERWLEHWSQPIESGPFAGGRIEHYVDITTLWQRAPTSAEPIPTDRLARAYDSCPVGICYFDKDLRFVHINKWLAELGGLPVAAHLGRTVEEIVPGIAIGIVDSLRSVLETGTPVVHGAVVGETRGQPGVGRIFRHSYYPDRADDGTVVGVSCFVEEVTHRRQIEAALEQVAERYRSVLETIPHGIETIDVDGKIVFANTALHRLYRCNPGELIGRSIFDFVEEAERNSLSRYLAYLVEKQPAPHPHEGRKVAMDGTIFEIRTDWAYRYDSNRQVEGFISVITDRTSDGPLAELE